MEIEEPQGTRRYRKLISPLQTDDSTVSVGKKPGLNSRSIGVENFKFSFKSYLIGSECFSYRCNHRSICKCLVNIPINGNFNSFLEINESIANYAFINEHSEACKTLNEANDRSKDSLIQVEKFESNFSVLRAFVEQNPLFEPRIIKVEMLKKQQKFKLIQIAKVVQEIRNELFVRDPDKVFSSVYCKALDSDQNAFNLFKSHVKIPYFPKNKNILCATQEFVILANNPMLKHLSAAKQWFLDATFKVAPQNFKQILNIIIYIPHLNIYYPACHIFMSHKTEELYSMAFQCLKQVALNIGNFVLEPKIIMCDFEQAMRKSITKLFPQINLSGCYFHFVKALYDKLTKLGLRKKTYKPKCQVLISYIQLLSHCPQDARETLFAELEAKFKNEDKKFSQFFKYFRKNWLKNPFMDELYTALETDDDIKFIRTNNPCETFHLFLGNLYILLTNVIQ